MDARVQVVTIVGALALLLIVLELVRRWRLRERYALLWILSASVLLVFALWTGALTGISHVLGIAYPSNALFFVAIACIVMLLLHFSAAVSRLSDQSETLAQRQALLEERLHSEMRTRDSSELTPDALSVQKTVAPSNLATDPDTATGFDREGR